MAMQQWAVGGGTELEDAGKFQHPSGRALGLEL